MTDTFDPKNRQLCPDGVCIGVIGATGRCSVCGRAGDPALTVTGAHGDSEAQADSDADLDMDAETESDHEPDTEAPFTDDDHGDDGGTADDDRQLCSDGACIGVIGPDGRCKVCGLPATAATGS